MSDIKPSSQKTEFLEVLKQRDFFSLWVGQIVASIGDRFYQFAILNVVILMSTTVAADSVTTGVGKESSRILFFGMLPTVLLFPWLGQIVDRFCRKRVMLITDLVRAVCALTMLVLWVGLDFKSPPLMFFLIAVAGLMNGLFIPARQAAVPLLVESNQLVRANALVTVVGIVASLFGAAAGFFVAVFGERSSFMITTAGFLFSAWMISRIKTSMKLREKVSLKAQWSQIGDMIKAVLGDPIVRFLFFFSGGTQFIIGLFFIFVLEYTVGQMELRILEQFAAWYANVVLQMGFKKPEINLDLLALVLLLCSTGVGLISGVVIAGKFYHFSHLEGLPILMFAILGLGFVGFSYVETLSWAIFASMLIGCTSALLNIPIDSRLQAHVQDRTHGRVFAMKTAWMHVCFLLAMVLNLNGQILEWFGAQRMLLTLGLVCVVLGGMMAVIYRKQFSRFWDA
ncbi:MAG: MFS transporter [Verrucomicrobiota bacterium]